MVLKGDSRENGVAYHGSARVQTQDRKVKGLVPLSSHRERVCERKPMGDERSYSKRKSNIFPRRLPRYIDEENRPVVVRSIL